MRANNLVSELNEELDKKNMEGLWNEALWDSDAKIMTKDPQTAVLPYLWKGDDIIGHLETAGELIGLEGKVERRTLRLINPGLRGLRGQKRATTQNIHMSVQLLKPGEHATSHRHNFSAFRFIIKGNGAYTVVNGEKFVMEEGDLILNPPNAWHGHGNDAEPIIWLDGLDYPLIISLQVLTWEAFPDEFQPLKDYGDYTEHKIGMARPVGRDTELAPLAYKWKDTYRTLSNLRDTAGSPFDGVALEYTNELNDGFTFPTMSCWVQMLRGGEETRTHRHNSSSVYHCFRGRGVTMVNGEEFHWRQGDCFVVPLWSWHSHKNLEKDEEAILFSMNDLPVLKALKLYREEAAD